MDSRNIGVQLSTKKSLSLPGRSKTYCGVQPAMALTANSEVARTLAHEILEFQEWVIDPESEIAALAEAFSSISAALSTLKRVEDDPRNVYGVDDIQDDKRIILRSLEYTFGDVRRLFGGLRDPKYRTNTEAYNEVWADIEEYFLEEGNNALLNRLDYYYRFLKDLIDVAKGRVFLKPPLKESH